MQKLLDFKTSLPLSSSFHRDFICIHTIPMIIYIFESQLPLFSPCISHFLNCSSCHYKYLISLIIVVRLHFSEIAWFNKSVTCEKVRATEESVTLSYLFIYYLILSYSSHFLIHTCTSYYQSYQSITLVLLLSLLYFYKLLSLFFV